MIIVWNKGKYSYNNDPVFGNAATLNYSSAILVPVGVIYTAIPDSDKKFYESTEKNLTFFSAPESIQAFYITSQGFSGFFVPTITQSSFFNQSNKVDNMYTTGDI